MARTLAAQLLWAWWAVASYLWEVAAQANACAKITGGTCKVFGCDESRGPTDCVHGQCICKEGYCNNRGTCQDVRSPDPMCNTYTGYHWLPFTATGCRSWQGETYTSLNGLWWRCYCKPGYCSVLGKCYPDRHTLTARVVPVNQDQPTFPGPHGKVKTALALSGGGARAHTVSFGVLQAMHHLRLLDQVDLLSSVSGGTWAAAIYMFAKMPLEELLGAPTDPSLLSVERLILPPAALGAAATVPTSHLVQKNFGPEEDVANPLLWTFTVGEAILKNFDLYRLDAFMAASQEDVERIKRANPHLQDADFLVPAPGRPKAFVMGGALLAPSGYVVTGKSAVSLQMSPDYAGSPFYPNGSTVSYAPTEEDQGDAALSGLTVGGGFVETFAFGSQAPLSGQSGGDAVKMASPLEPLSLAKAVAISSAAPAAALLQFANNFKLPTFTGLELVANYWPIISKELPSTQPAMTYTLGDGGNIENGGVLQALQRGAERVVVVMATNVPIYTEVDFCGLGSTDEVARFAVKLESSLQANFGFAKRNDEVGQFITQNQVFAREDLAPLLCDLQGMLKAGKPTVVRKRLKVLANSWWGIKSYTATFIFLYNDKCAEFEALLPNDTKDEIQKGPEGGLKNYPHYSTVLQNINSGEVTALTPMQVNLLAAQSEYAVLQNRALFEELLCERETGGTCRAFSCAGWRNARCERGRCVCGAEADTCAASGACVPRVAPVAEVEREAPGRPSEVLLQDADAEAERVVEFAGAAAGCAALAAALAARLCRRRSVHLSEDLLG